VVLRLLAGTAAEARVAAGPGSWSAPGLAGGLAAVPAARACRDLCCHHPGARFIWASTRQIYNAAEAREAGFDVITMAPEMILKMDQLTGRDLHEYSRETVEQFRRDALESGITL